MGAHTYHQLRYSPEYNISHEIIKTMLSRKIDLSSSWKRNQYNKTIFCGYWAQCSGYYLQNLWYWSDSLLFQSLTSLQLLCLIFLLSPYSVTRWDSPKYTLTNVDPLQIDTCWKKAKINRNRLNHIIRNIFQKIKGRIYSYIENTKKIY